MRTTLLTLCLAASLCLAFSQGQIVFMNNSSTAITNFYTGQRASTDTRVGFYVNADTTVTSQTAPGWVRIYTTNLFVPGIFFGGTRELRDDTGVSFPPYTPVAVQVRAWLSAVPYNSLEEALALNPTGVLWGSSVIMIITPTVPLAPQPTLPANGLQPWLLINGIPEPSIIALALLGLGVMALFRRGRF